MLDNVDPESALTLSRCRSQTSTADRHRSRETVQTFREFVAQRQHRRSGDAFACGFLHTNMAALQGSKARSLAARPDAWLQRSSSPFPFPAACRYAAPLLPLSL